MESGRADEFMKKYGMSFPWTESNSAKNAGPDLLEKPEVGFQNLLKHEKFKDISGSEAPVGAILVYEGGAHGHVEIKTGENEYISDHRKTRPTNETCAYRRATRKLIGVYVKTE